MHANQPTTTNQHAITWIDMQEFVFGTPQQKINLANQFGKALQEIGFVAVTNIGIRAETINRAYSHLEKYFAMPEEWKMKNYAVDGHQGYTPFGKEHAKYTDISDLKEFYQTTGPSQPGEKWPEQIEFKDAMLLLYLELETCLKNCLQATAIYLGYHEQPTILSDLLGYGESVMRVIHYPPLDQHEFPAGALRSAPHEDLSIMTVIPRATHAGLQVQNRQGEWFNVVVPDGAAIINSGDTLSRLTNGVIPSTTHRVVNPAETNTHRYSIPFFGGLAQDTVLRILDKCILDTPRDQLPKEITFGEFFNMRYREIGIMK